MGRSAKPVTVARIVILMRTSKQFICFTINAFFDITLSVYMFNYFR